jgi:hypothetical protein
MDPKPLGLGNLFVKPKVWIAKDTLTLQGLEPGIALYHGPRSISTCSQIAGEGVLLRSNSGC